MYDYIYKITCIFIYELHVITYVGWTAALQRQKIDLRQNGINDPDLYPHNVALTTFFCNLENLFSSLCFECVICWGTRAMRRQQVFSEIVFISEIERQIPPHATESPNISWLFGATCIQSSRYSFKRKTAENVQICSPIQEVVKDDLIKDRKPNFKLKFVISQHIQENRDFTQIGGSDIYKRGSKNGMAANIGCIIQLEMPSELPCQDTNVNLTQYSTNHPITVVTVCEGRSESDKTGCKKSMAANTGCIMYLEMPSELPCQESIPIASPFEIGMESKPIASPFEIGRPAQSRAYKKRRMFTDR
ncbi:hypothetical protein LXL04_020867 [Taraxacum kok-saghyz]